MLLVIKTNGMLADKKLKAFVPTVNPLKAKKFYGDVLGLTLLSEDGFALEYDANGTSLRITTVKELKPHPFTVLGWEVDDIQSAVESLHKQGVMFEQYNFPGQDQNGIWTAPGSSMVAWFKDPDGNLLSISQHKKTV